MISVTSGFAFVRVPVLSNTTTSISFVFSKVSAVFMRIPFFAHTPVPTIIAVGVARPRAQGQAITRSATDAIIAFDMSHVMRNQAIKVINAMTIIVGTNIQETLSAKCSIGALEL
jgi:hypothetical protein